MQAQFDKTKKNLVPDFPDHEIQLLADRARPVSVKANEYFIRRDETPKKFGFVCKGLLRYLYIDNEGREYTKGIFCENSFVSSDTAMKTSHPFFLRSRR